MSTKILHFQEYLNSFITTTSSQIHCHFKAVTLTPLQLRQRSLYTQHLIEYLYNAAVKKIVISLQKHFDCKNWCIQETASICKAEEKDSIYWQLYANIDSWPL